MAKEYKVNDQIKTRNINLVLLDGEIRESILLSEALEIAGNEGLDVVEVSEKGKLGLPVCKLMDYGKMMYEQNKKKKQSKKQIQHVKEIKYGLNIGSHDLEIRHKKILKFLSKKYTVKYIMELKGRERSMTDKAVKIINDNLEEFKELAKWKTPQVSRGRRITISTVLMPV